MPEDVQRVVSDKETKYLLRFSATALSIIGVLLLAIANNFNNRLNDCEHGQIIQGNLITDHAARISTNEGSIKEIKGLLAPKLYASKPDEMRTTERGMPLQ